MKTFAAVRPLAPPSSRAVVRSAAMSVPPLGSLSAKAASARPAHSSGSQVRCCSSLP